MKSVIWIFALCLIGLPTLGICQGDEELPPEWVFDEEEEIEKWISMNQLAALELDEVEDKSGNNRTVLKTESLGGDPHVYLVGGGGEVVDGINSFDGGEYDTIYIGVRVSKSGTWQIYYITKEDAQYSERQRQNFQVDKTDDFVDLEFKMETGGWQEETITGIRLDPGRVAGIEAEIDYISLRGVPEEDTKAVEFTGKLAVAWGAIKR